MEYEITILFKITNNKYVLKAASKCLKDFKNNNFINFWFHAEFGKDFQGIFSLFLPIIKYSNKR